MEENDVAGSHDSEEVVGVVVQRLLVDAALAGAERAGVTPVSVQVVVDALRDPEEGRAALDDELSGVDPDPTGVGQQRLEELGHSAPLGGGVDIDDGAPAEQLPRHVGHRVEVGRPLLANDVLEGLGRSGLASTSTSLATVAASLTPDPPALGEAGGSGAL
jgi:hypothetical protein